MISIAFLIVIITVISIMLIGVAIAVSELNTTRQHEEKKTPNLNDSYTGADL